MINRDLAEHLNKNCMRRQIIKDTAIFYCIYIYILALIVGPHLETY